MFIKYYDAEIFVAAGRKIRNTVMSADWSYVNILDTKSQTFFMMHF